MRRAAQLVFQQTVAAPTPTRGFRTDTELEDRSLLHARELGKSVEMGIAVAERE
jgi:hypothetical protein